MRIRQSLVRKASALSIADLALSFAVVLNFVGLILTCVMLSAETWNCALIKNARWGANSNLFPGTMYLGLSGACIERHSKDSGDFVSFSELSSAQNDIFGDFYKCGAAGDVALTFTLFLSLGFIFSLWVLHRRLCGDHSYWRVGAMTCLVATTCAVIALGSFNGKCNNFGRNHFDNSISMDMGAFNVFALLTTVGVHVYTVDFLV